MRIAITDGRMWPSPDWEVDNVKSVRRTSVQSELRRKVTIYSRNEAHHGLYLMRRDETVMLYPHYDHEAT